MTINQNIEPATKMVQGLTCTDITEFLSWIDSYNSNLSHERTNEIED